MKNHLDVLERLFLVRVRQPWHVNLGSRQVKAPKLYLSDTGLLGALVGADVSRVREDDGFAGALFEKFVATELERQASWFEQPLTFWHYREARREVDVIVERPSGEIIGLEIKVSATCASEWASAWSAGRSSTQGPTCGSASAPGRSRCRRSGRAPESIASRYHDF